MYHFLLGTRVTACPAKLFGVPLTDFLPCFSATRECLSPVSLSLNSIFALLKLLLVEMAGKFTETGATASVTGCVPPVGGVIYPIFGVIKIYSSASAGTAGGAIKAAPGGSITAVSGGADKSPPGDSSAMIFCSVPSVLDAMVGFC